MARNRGPIALATLAIASLAAAQCNPTNATAAPCAPIEGLTEPLYVDFTKISSVPSDFIVASYEDSYLHFGSKGLEFRLDSSTAAPYIWTSKYMQYGTASAIMQAAPGIGVISSAVLISDDGDEIDYEMSGNDFGNTQIPTIQTNYYGKAMNGNWDRGTQPTVSADVTTHFFNYTQVWTPTQIQWLINGTVVRTLLASECDDGNHQYPQTPSRFHLGIWDAGGANAGEGTITWAGGHTPDSTFPTSMYLKSVYIQPYQSCPWYQYSDTTGDSNSVECLSSLDQASADASSPTQTLMSQKAPTATTIGAASCPPAPTHTQPGTPDGCQTYYLVQSGDDCEKISTSLSISQDDLKSWNPQIGDTCENVWVNYYICVSTPGVCDGTSSSASTTITATSKASSTGSSNTQASGGSPASLSLAPSSLQLVASQVSATSDSGLSTASAPVASGNLGGNPIYKPGSGSIVPAGKPYNITWQPTTSGTISLVLLKGPSSNMIFVTTIASNIANSGYYVWTPSTSLAATSDATGYGVQLIVTSNGDYQWSTQFGISNDDYTVPMVYDLPVTTNGRCGVDFGTICKGSVFGDCCSAYGNCGNASDYCSTIAGCVPQYGRCDDGSSSDVSSSSFTIAATSPGSSGTAAISATKSSSTGGVSGNSASGTAGGRVVDAGAASSTFGSTAAAASSTKATSTTVAVTFNEIVTTAWMETIILVGSIGELGNWSPSSGVVMSASQYTDSNHLWSVTVNLPAGQSIEYKYVRNGTDGSLSWEADPNHSYTVPAVSVMSATRSDTWQAVSSTSKASSTAAASSTAQTTSSSSSSVKTTATTSGTSSFAASSTKSSSSSTPNSSSASITTATKVTLSASSTLSSAVATVSSPSGDPDGFSYTGCYSEVSGRALSEKSTANNAMTLDVCAAFCKNYAWFGVEYGNECYCGNKLSSSSSPCHDGRCKMSCAGNRGKTCGGSNGLSLYKSCTVKAQGDPTVLNGTNGYVSMGCWSDSFFSRSLDTVWLSNQMTIELCAAQARKEGLKFFGVEYGNQCWMGNSMDHSPKSLGQNYCSVKCPGDSGEYCGGSNALQMYNNTGATTSTSSSSNNSGWWSWW